MSLVLQSIIDELRRLEGEATPGPWKQPGATYQKDVLYESQPDWFVRVANCDEKNDAALVVAMRNALTQLSTSARS